MKQKRTDKIIKYGRICLYVIIIGSTIFLTIYFAIIDRFSTRAKRSDKIVKWGAGLMWAYFSLSILLFICVFWLVSLLRRKREQVDWQRAEKAHFNKEICKLWIILSVFSSVYLVRGCGDAKFIPGFESFTQLIWDILQGILYDFIPVMLIMYFHYRNFS